MKAHTEGVTAARRLLIEGLIGQAKALRQLEKRDEFFLCLSELVHFDPMSKVSRQAVLPPGILFEWKRPYAEQIEEILDGMRSTHSA